jgi:hypothetical protein
MSILKSALKGILISMIIPLGVFLKVYSTSVGLNKFDDFGFGLSLAFAAPCLLLSIPVGVIIGFLIYKRKNSYPVAFLIVVAAALLVMFYWPPM